MSTQHTQGPWAVSKGSVLQVKAVNAPSHNTVALCGDYFDRPMQEANARLIAAAPELLEALQAYRHANAENNWGLKVQADLKACAAIAKATGVQP